MYHREKLNPVVILFAVLLLTVLALLGLRQNPITSLIWPVAAPPQEVVDAAEASFDYVQAAENSAYRWQAMARYYAEHDLLTRDDFDYDAAAENSAYRWQAMARYYAEHDLLTRDDFDYDAAADNLAFRWQAMARYYEKLGLLNE